MRHQGQQPRAVANDARTMRNTAFGTVSVMALMLAHPALAQDATPPAAATPDTPAETPGASQTYTADFFTRFSPRTALDMLRQVPGFTIRDHGGDMRGLGTATENVLINGARIAAKSTTATQQLERISASAVVRIEIVDAGTLSIPGLSGEVANVIITETGMTTTFKWQPEFRKRLENNWLRGEVSTSGKIGGNSITVSVKNEANRNGHWGPEDVFDGTGVFQFRREEYGRYYGDAPHINASLARTARNGNVLNLNGAFGQHWNRNIVLSDSAQPGIGLVQEVDRWRGENWHGEVGGDYTFGLWGGKLKTIALERRNASEGSGRFITTNPTVTSGARYDDRTKGGETILRSEYSWKTAGGTDWQIALEGAYNRLDVDGTLFDLTAPGTWTAIEEGETTHVREKRGELLVNWSRALASDLQAQLNIGGEYSAISSETAGHGLTRRFFRPKGKLSLAWKVDPLTTINWEVQRRVDQLSFGDFARSVDLANNTGNAANARLVPPQVWRTQVEVVRDLQKWGKLTLVGALARPEDIVDQVPLSPTTEGRGNLKSGKVARVGLSGSILFDPLGWKGAKLDFDASRFWRSVRDPLLGNRRPMSSHDHYYYTLNFRHDVPGTQWAWGVDIEAYRNFPYYGLSQIFDSRNTPPIGVAFVEHKDVFGMNVSVALVNLFDQRDRLTRWTWAPRRDGTLVSVQDSNRRFGKFFSVTVSGKI